MGEEQRLNPPHATELRYAILQHTGIPDPHFDLLIETSPGSLLATWRCPIWPITEPTPLTRLNDHRRLYLDFEGPLTGNRGTVRRVETGLCKLHIGEDGAWHLQIGEHRVTVVRFSSTDCIGQPFIAKIH